MEAHSETDRPSSDPVALQIPAAPARDIETSARSAVVGIIDTTPETLSAVEKVWPGGRRFGALPMLAGDASPTELEAVAAIPGTAQALLGQAYPAVEPLLTGIDSLLMVEVACRAGFAAPYTLGGIDEESPESPVLVERDGSFLVDSAPPAYPTRMGHQPVMNLSLGPTSVDAPSDPRDPVNIATFLASHLILPIFAAGNDFQREGRETMSAWAEMPWALAVGATDDPAGTLLARYSSAGIEGVPASGPDLTAYGRSELDCEVDGTSFAAPRVTGHAAFLAAVVWQLAHAAPARAPAGPTQTQGIPIVGWGVIDEFGADRMPVEERLEIPALPPLAVDGDALGRTLTILAERGVPSDVTSNPERLRRMLLAACRPISQYGPHLVGAGFISEETVYDWLADFSGAHFAWLFSDKPPGSEAMRDLANVRLFDRGSLELLRKFVMRSAPVWRFDWKSRGFAMRATASEIAPAH